MAEGQGATRAKKEASDTDAPVSGAPNEATDRAAPTDRGTAEPVREADERTHVEAPSTHDLEAVPAPSRPTTEPDGDRTIEANRLAEGRHSSPSGPLAVAQERLTLV
jgi:hypothetical protein